MLKLDIKKVEFKKQHNDAYAVYYAVANTTDKKFPNYEKWIKSSCYGSFFQKLGVQKEVNKMFTTFEILPTSIELTEQDVVNWITLCKKHKFLPEYLITKNCFGKNKNGKINRGFLTINIDMNMPQSMLYMYLDTFRHMKEDPGFVKAILYLCNEKGMDFCIAYILASHFNIVGTGHHAVLVTATLYANENDPKPVDMKGNLNLKMVRSLYKFINDNNTTKGAILKNAASWNCNNLIANITDNDMVVPIEDLNKPEIVAIAHEFNCDKAVKLHAKFTKKINTTIKRG